MAHVNGEITINRPVQEVFDFVADERNEPRYNPRMLRAEKLSPGPVGPGSRFRAVMRSWPRPTTMTSEFTMYQRPRRLASTSCLSTMDIEGTLSFDPVSEGTRMRWSWQLQPRGLLKLMTPVVAAWAGAWSKASGQASSAFWKGNKPHLHRPGIGSQQQEPRRFQ
jgi:Polyketide cyclase / dehydrase and lipid transport